MDPVTASLILGGLGFLGGSGASAGQKQISREEIQARLKMAGMDDKRARDLAMQVLMGHEQELDPYRNQLQQAGAASKLDRLERGTYNPVKLNLSGVPSRYASAMPQMSGGYQYSKSPELRAGAGKLKNSVLSGQTTPTASQQYASGARAYSPSTYDLTSSPYGTTDRTAGVPGSMSGDLPMRQPGLPTGSDAAMQALGLTPESLALARSILNASQRGFLPAGAPG